MTTVGRKKVSVAKAPQVFARAKPDAVSHSPATSEPPIPSGVGARRRLQQDQNPPEAVGPSALRARAENESVESVYKKHLVDFRTAFAEMRKQPPSIVFFGGARLKPGDPYYELAVKFGKALAHRGIPPKTGAGPGAMHAVPMGFIDEREKLTTRLVQTLIAGVSRDADLSSLLTQGYNIALPHEQAVSPSIEDASEIQQFAFRKFALYENARGIVVFPGGFGTLDELLEVLILARAGKTRDPVVLAGAAYWKPIIDAWKDAAKKVGAQTVVDLLDDVLVTDDPDAALDYIESHKNVRAFESDPDALYKRMIRELKLARYVATRQEPTVTFLGGATLAQDHSSMKLGREIALYAAEKKQPMRVGDDGPIAKMLRSVGANPQKILWNPEAGEVPRHEKPRLDRVTFRERIPHKEVLLRNSSAYIVLPDAERGKDELMTVLCQIQTGKLPRRPLLLVDSEFWKPIIESWRQTMLGENHAYIEESDLELFQFVDTLDEAKTALGM